MKFFAICLFFTTTLFAEHFTLQNATSFRDIAIQWASSARMVQENNDSIMQRDSIPKKSLFYPRQNKATISIPKNAAYFRVLIWEGLKKNLPDFLTNWVEIVPDKTYLLQKEHLTHFLLIQGMGC
jgi:hypothetical protein